MKINSYIQSILRLKLNSINFHRKDTDSLKKEKTNKELIKKKNNNNAKNKKNNNNDKNKKKNNNDKNNKNNKNNNNDKNNKSKNNKNKNGKENKNKNKNKRKVNENKSKINKKGKKMRISMRKSLKKGNKKHNFPPKRKSISSINKDTSRKTLEEYVSSQHFKSKKNLLLLKEKNSNNEKKNLIKNSKFQKQVDIVAFNKITDLKMKNKKLNDEELNNLDYDLAIIIDKRTYFQYYISLLKKKQLILFAFWPSNDYNLVVIKIALFLLSFSLYFTVNGFFFSDKTMNKINEDKGAFDIIFQIPQILYSSVISAVINVILKQLSLSERQILTIKQEKNFKVAQKKSNQIRKYIKIKLALFFIFSILLMLFFWYFISAFCAVYKNTQMILIKDTLISFGLSMLYPFGLNLIPGMFRIPALSAAKKDKKCLYKFSLLVAFI